MIRAYDMGYEDGWDDGKAGKSPFTPHSDPNYLKGYTDGYRDGKGIREVLNRVGK